MLKLHLVQRINQWTYTSFLWNFLKICVNEEHFESATNINPMLDNHLYSLSSVWTKKVSYHDGNECNAIDYSQVSWRCIWHIKKIRDACTERVKWDAHKFEGRVKVTMLFLDLNMPKSWLVPHQWKAILQSIHAPNIQQ